MHPLSDILTTRELQRWRLILARPPTIASAVSTSVPAR